MGGTNRRTGEKKGVFMYVCMYVCILFSDSRESEVDLRLYSRACIIVNLRRSVAYIYMPFLEIDTVML